MQLVNNKETSKKIKTLRSRMGWSQEKLARQMDVSLFTVQRWELQRTKPSKPYQKELNKLFKRAGMR